MNKIDIFKLFIFIFVVFSHLFIFNIQIENKNISKNEKQSLTNVKFVNIMKSKEALVIKEELKHNIKKIKNIQKKTDTARIKKIKKHAKKTFKKQKIVKKLKEVKKIKELKITKKVEELKFKIKENSLEKNIKKIAIIKEINRGKEEKKINEQSLALYMKYIHNRIEEEKFYPKIAKRMGLKGKCILQFNVLKNGEIKNISFYKKASFNILNKSALKILENINSFKPFPINLQKEILMIKIPIKYVKG